MAAALALIAAAPAFAGSADRRGGLTVSNAWFRMIVPGRPAGGYFLLTNDGDTARDLVGASSPACGTAMLHQSISENGTDKMVMVDHVEVPAHGSVEFAPGGYHVMCMKPTDEHEARQHGPGDARVQGRGQHRRHLCGEVGDRRLIRCPPFTTRKTARPIRRHCR